MKANRITSRTFLIGVFICFFRHIPRLIPTQMKRAPSNPQITPKSMPAGKSKTEFTSPSERLPSFRVEESDKLKG